MTLLPNMDKFNLAVNPGFERQSLGGGAVTADGEVSDGWFLDEGAGSTMSIAADTTNEDGFSDTCLAATYSVHAAATHLYQIAGADLLVRLRNGVVSLGMRVNMTTAVTEALRLWTSVDGGTTKVYGPWANAATGYQTLKCEGSEVTDAATALWYGIEFNKVVTAYLDNAVLCTGSAVADFQDALGFDQFAAASAGFPAGTLQLFETANNTVDITDQGYIHTSTLDGIVYTLPATVVGYSYTFMNVAEDGKASVAVSPDAADLIAGAGFTAADNKDIVNTKATARRGDYVTLIGNGTTGWNITAMRGIWAREA